MRKIYTAMGHLKSVDRNKSLIIAKENLYKKTQLPKSKIGQSMSSTTVLKGNKLSL